MAPFVDRFITHQQFRGVTCRGRPAELPPSAVNMAGHGFAPVAGFVIDGAPGSARAPFREEFMMVEVT